MRGPIFGPPGWPLGGRWAVPWPGGPGCRRRLGRPGSAQRRRRRRLCAATLRGGRATRSGFWTSGSRRVCVCAGGGEGRSAWPSRVISTVSAPRPRHRPGLNRSQVADCRDPGRLPHPRPWSASVSAPWKALRLGLSLGSPAQGQSDSLRSDPRSALGHGARAPRPLLVLRSSRSSIRMV